MIADCARIMVPPFVRSNITHDDTVPIPLPFPTEHNDTFHLLVPRHTPIAIFDEYTIPGTIRRLQVSVWHVEATNMSRIELMEPIGTSRGTMLRVCSTRVADEQFNGNITIHLVMMASNDSNHLDDRIEYIESVHLMVAPVLLVPPIYPLRRVLMFLPTFAHTPTNTADRWLSQLMNAFPFDTTLLIDTRRDTQPPLADRVIEARLAGKEWKRPTVVLLQPGT